MIALTNECCDCFYSYTMDANWLSLVIGKPVFLSITLTESVSRKTIKIKFMLPLSPTLLSLVSKSLMFMFMLLTETGNSDSYWK